MYNSVLTFASVDICPRSIQEIFCLVVVLLISAMVNAQIFGIFASLTEELTERTQKLELSMDTANAAIIDL